MKKKESISVTLAVIIGLALGGCSQSMASSNREASSNVQIQVASTSKNRILTTDTTLASSEAEMNKQEGNIMKITVGDKILTAVLSDNSSADAFKEILSSGPLTIDMSDYGNMEKMGPIGQSLPTNDEQITTAAGDIILYMGNSLVIYYDTNSWNFTKLGKIQDITQEELKEILGADNVAVTFSLEEELF